MNTKDMGLAPEEKIALVQRYSALYMPRLPYHNYDHAVDVAQATERLADLENLGTLQRFLLQTGAYFHDIIYEINAKDNEERSALLAEDFLPIVGYDYEDIFQVSSLVMATKISTKPKSKLEKLMCDADVDNLGRPDFFDKCELLRQERGVEDKKVWYTNALKFLQGHQYYTEAAKDLRQKGFEENMKNLQRLVYQL